MNRFAKFVAVVLVLGIIVSAVPAKAATTAELEAQIAQLQALIASLTGQLGGGSSAGSSASYTYTVYTYTVDLTLGSKGADVTALQQFLVSKGFLTMPAGASYGTFGPLTKAALAAFQASAGISPAAGYFGPKTRAYMNSMVVVTPSVTPSMPAGFTPSPSGLTGGEGIITVETNATPASGATYYEGDQNASLLGLKVRAQNSDLRVERLRVNLGDKVTVYTKTFSSLSLWDGSTLLQEIALNSNSVVKDGSNYIVTFSGFGMVVPNNTTKVLTLKGTIMGVVTNLYRSATIIIPANGVRARDAAGLDQYGPGSQISRSFTISPSLMESAQLIMSKSSNSPKSGNLVSDSQGNLTEATVGVFDFRAKNDMVKVDQMVLNVGTAANPTAAFLYDGSSMISSASVSGKVATFTNMEDNFQIMKDQTKAVTIKVTYSGVNSTVATTSVSIAAASNVTAYNSEGVKITGGNLSGTPASETMNVISVGPVISLTSAVNTLKAGVQGVSSSSISGEMKLTVTAVGGDIYFTTGTTTAALLSVYDGSTVKGAATNTDVSFDSSFVQQSPATTYKLSEGTTGVITVTSVVKANEVTGNFLHFRLSGVKWGKDGTIAAAGTTSTSLDETVYKTAPSYPLP